MEGRRKKAGWWLAIAAVLASGAACGSVIEPVMNNSQAGPNCSQNEDCVPNACCGRGTRAVHLSEAPDCSAVKCSARCPPAELDCGCALPVCRNGHCAVAYTSGSTCP